MDKVLDMLNKIKLAHSEMKEEVLDTSDNYEIDEMMFDEFDDFDDSEDND